MTISRDITKTLSVSCHTVCLAGYVIKLILDFDAEYIVLNQYVSGISFTNRDFLHG